MAIVQETATTEDTITGLNEAGDLVTEKRQRIMGGPNSGSPGDIPKQANAPAMKPPALDEPWANLDAPAAAVDSSMLPPPQGLGDPSAAQPGAPVSGAAPLPTPDAVSGGAEPQFPPTPPMPAAPPRPGGPVSDVVQGALPPEAQAEAVVKARVDKATAPFDDLSAAARAQTEVVTLQNNAEQDHQAQAGLALADELERKKGAADEALEIAERDLTSYKTKRQDIEENRTDPGRVFKSPGGILAALAFVVASMFRAKAGPGPNEALEALNNMIDRDVGLQREQQAKDLAALQSSKASDEEILAQKREHARELSAAYPLRLQAIDTSLRERLAGIKNPEARAQLMEALAKIGAQRATAEETMEQTLRTEAEREVKLGLAVRASDLQAQAMRNRGGGGGGSKAPVSNEVVITGREVMNTLNGTLLGIIPEAIAADETRVRNWRERVNGTQDSVRSFHRLAKMHTAADGVINAMGFEKYLQSDVSAQYRAAYTDFISARMRALSGISVRPDEREVQMTAFPIQTLMTRGVAGAWRNEREKQRDNMTALAHEFGMDPKPFLAMVVNAPRHSEPAAGLDNRELEVIARDTNDPVAGVGAIRAIIDQAANRNIDLTHKIPILMMTMVSLKKKLGKPLPETLENPPTPEMVLVADDEADEMMETLRKYKKAKPEPEPEPSKEEFLKRRQRFDSLSNPSNSKR